MINGTGKQAIKNAVPPVTFLLRTSSLSPIEAGRYASRHAPKTPARTGNGTKINGSAPEWGLAETER